MHLPDPQLGGNGIGGAGAVSGEQHRLHTAVMQGPDHISALLPDGIGEHKIPRRMRFPFHCNIDHSASPVNIGLRAGIRRQRNSRLRHHCGIACQHALSLQNSFHAPGQHHLKPLRLRQRMPAAVPIAGHHRFPQGMLRELLCRRGHPVNPLPGIVGRQTHYRDDLGFSVGQCPGLVKCHPGHLGKPLQGVALPHEESVFCGVSDGCHDGCWRGQHQRTGAEYHQDGDRADDLSGHQPGQNSSRQRHHDHPGGPPVRHPHDFGLSGVGGLHQPDHALDGAVLPHFDRPHLKGAELVHRPARDRIPHALIHRQRLSGHHRLIDGCLSRCDHTVHRYALSGQHPQQIPHLHLLRRDHSLHTIFQHPGRLGRQMYQLLDSRPGFCHGQLLQQRPKLHDKRHLACRKILADADRGDQRHGYQHVRLDVESGDQPDGRLQQNGHAAQDDRDPRGIKRQRHRIQYADQKRSSGNDQQNDVLLDAAGFQKFLQSLYPLTHKRLPLYPMGYGYYIP